MVTTTSILQPAEVGGWRFKRRMAYVIGRGTERRERAKLRKKPKQNVWNRFAFTDRFGVAMGLVRLGRPSMKKSGGKHTWKDPDTGATWTFNEQSRRWSKAGKAKKKKATKKRQTRKSGDVWQTKSGWAAMKGKTKRYKFPSEKAARAWLEGKKKKGKDDGQAKEKKAQEDKPDIAQRSGADERRGRDVESTHGRGDRRIDPAKERIVTARGALTPKADTSLVPESVREHLSDHQQQGIALGIKAMDTHGGFVLADSTGVGKTRQELAIAKKYADDCKKVLIVAPAQVIKPDWKKGTVTGSWDHDSKAMGVDVTLNKGDQPLKECGVHITTYDRLSKFRGKTDSNTVLMFEESHSIKNFSSARSKHAYHMSKPAHAVLYATATPADKPLHIAHMFRAGVFGQGSWDETYRRLGMVKKKIHIGGGQTIQQWQIDPHVGKAEVYRRMSGLFDKMTEEGLMVRRELSLDGVDLGVEQLKLPQEAHDMLERIEEAISSESDAGDGLTRARILMHQRRQQEPYKVPAAVRMAKEAVSKGEQVVIFASRVNKSEIKTKAEEELIAGSEGTVQLLKQQLAEAGITDIGELHGGQAKGKSKQAMTDFQGGKNKVLIATIESGGVGINLDDTEGDKPRSMIMMTPPFSAVDNMQALGRVWRLKTESYPDIKYIFGDTEVDRWNASLITGKMKTLGASVGGELEGLDIETGEREPIEPIEPIEPEDRFEWPDLTRKRPADPSQATIGFGKHKGKKFSEVPEGYLQWIVGEFESTGRKGETRAAAQQELKRRQEAKPPPKKKPAKEPAPTTPSKPKAASPARLRSGDWGARVPGGAKEGDRLEITTRKGKTFSAVVDKVIWSGDDVSLVATRRMSLMSATDWGQYSYNGWTMDNRKMRRMACRYIRMKRGVKRDDVKEGHSAWQFRPQAMSLVRMEKTTRKPGVYKTPKGYGVKRPSGERNWFKSREAAERWLKGAKKVGQRRPDAYWGSKEQPFFRPGPNPTVDNVITRSKDGKRQVLLIRRKPGSTEGGKWALPGGFHDSTADKGQPWKKGKETAKQAALRELREETGLSVGQLQKRLKKVGQYGDMKQSTGRDPRDNKEAWAVTSAFQLHLPKTVNSDDIMGADDADRAQWVDVDQLQGMDLAFDHEKIVGDALGGSKQSGWQHRPELKKPWVKYESGKVVRRRKTKPKEVGEGPIERKHGKFPESTVIHKPVGGGFTSAIVRGRNPDGSYDIEIGQLAGRGTTALPQQAGKPAPQTERVGKFRPSGKVFTVPAAKLESGWSETPPERPKHKPTPQPAGRKKRQPRPAWTPQRWQKHRATVSNAYAEHTDPDKAKALATKIESPQDRRFALDVLDKAYRLEDRIVDLVDTERPVSPVAAAQATIDLVEQAFPAEHMPEMQINLARKLGNPAVESLGGARDFISGIVAKHRRDALKDRGVPEGEQRPMTPEEYDRWMAEMRGAFTEASRSVGGTTKFAKRLARPPSCVQLPDRWNVRGVAIALTSP